MHISMKTSNAIGVTCSSLIRRKERKGESERAKMQKMKKSKSFSAKNIIELIGFITSDEKLTCMGKQ